MGPEELARTLQAEGALSDPAWREAFARVPRELFVPCYHVATASGYERRWRYHPDPLERQRWRAGVYQDVPLATRLLDGELVSSSSQPSLMAHMLHALRVTGESRVLEIGTGPGYNAALLSHRLGEERVVTVDLCPEITAAARTHLAEAGYHPRVVTADGARGCPEHAPYDRVIATCGLDRVPPAWPAQCVPGARILAPVANGLLALSVDDRGGAQGTFLSTPAFFVPLRGGTPRGPAPDLSELPRGAASEDSLLFLLTLTAGRLPVGAAYRLWRDQGRPVRERYGITVRGDRQWAWLDDPEGPWAWPLPGSGGNDG
ncbi:methyltransferase domain-containing protein [Streptomyces sp. NPDC005438]|uniref:methyltransferase domain-containing protein n=1 Tax=Streptomyces sp. NPDC005438 TaxID=3156880 RepID=UPI0033ADC331